MYPTTLVHDIVRTLLNGKTVSKLCFGTLSISSLQRDFTTAQGADLLVYAASRGVNFIDTADLYQNYPMIKRALLQVDLCVATKSYAYDIKTAQESFARAVKGIGREYIDVFLLHEQESEHTLRGHQEAIDWLLKKKQEGLLGAVGISTHHVAGAVAAAKHQGLDVLHPLINLSGIGIADGTRDDMEQALAQADRAGLFIYAMKALGGGHLIRNRKDAFAYIQQLPFVHSVAVGMQSEQEVDYNLAMIAGEIPDESLAMHSQRKLMIHSWCEGCGACVARCSHGALTMSKGQATVDQDRCVLCGYCAVACPQFCMKVI